MGKEGGTEGVVARPRGTAGGGGAARPRGTARGAARPRTQPGGGWGQRGWRLDPGAQPGGGRLDPGTQPGGKEGGTEGVAARPRGTARGGETEGVAARPRGTARGGGGGTGVGWLDSGAQPRGGQRGWRRDPGAQPGGRGDRGGAARLTSATIIQCYPLHGAAQ